MKRSTADAMVRSKLVYYWECEAHNMMMAVADADEQTARLHLSIHLQMEHKIPWPESARIAGVEEAQ